MTKTRTRTPTVVPTPYLPEVLHLRRHGFGDAVFTPSDDDQSDDEITLADKVSIQICTYNPAARFVGVVAFAQVERDKAEAQAVQS